VSTSGIITTVAGNGVPAYSGDGGPATTAELYNPFGVAVDAFGNLFIADTFNDLVRKVSTSGVITTVAGNGIQGYFGDGAAAISAELYYPEGVAVDASGNLLIADTFNDRIRKVSASGIITTVAGNGSAGYSGDGSAAISTELYYPESVAVDASGNLFVADTNNNRIRKVSASSGIITTVAGSGIPGYFGDGGPATSAGLASPFGVAVDASGNLFIGDTYNDRIREVGIQSLTFSSGSAASRYACSNSAYLATNFFNPWEIKLIVSLRSSPAPSVRRIVP
jgi:trimeric autotransporter adhesin